MGRPSSVPTFDTERLTLRGHTVDDFADSARMWAEPEVVRHIGGRPFAREESWSRLLRYIGHWTALGFGYWVVIEKASGRFAGEIGFSDFKRELVPPLDGAPEIGWVLAPWAHGKGFATEAVRGAIAWEASHLGSVRTVCLIDVENVRSIRVAEKCGYKEYARSAYKGSPVILFEH
jgi:RimJ/RimL family protein N-acetyltransferase